MNGDIGTGDAYSIVLGYDLLTRYERKHVNKLKYLYHVVVKTYMHWIPQDVS